MRLVLVVFVAALVLGGAATSASPGRTTWISYLPKVAGRSCSLEHSSKTGGVAMTTRRRTLVERVSKNEVVDRATFDVLPRQSNRLLGASSSREDFRLLGNGRLETTPEWNESILGGASGGTGWETYPSLGELAGGKTVTSHLRLWSSGPVFKPLLLPGHSRVEETATVAVSAAPHVAKLATPAGTFRDVVGVRVRFVHIEITGGVRKAAAAELQSVMAMSSGISTELYYARGVGLVQYGISGGLAGNGLVEKLTSCT